MTQIFYVTHSVGYQEKTSLPQPFDKGLSVSTRLPIPSRKSLRKHLAGENGT